MILYLNDQLIIYNVFTSRLIYDIEILICSASKGPKAAQLTMFYNGQVVVFDDFPADKAQELMAFANKGISQTQNNNSLYTYTPSQPSFPQNSVRTSVDPIAPIVPTVNNIVPSTCNGSIHEHPQVLSRPNVCGNFLKP